MPDKIEFATKVQKIFEQYKNEIDESLDEVLKEVGKKTTQKLKERSPKKTGEYSKSWAYEVKKGSLSYEGVVYSKTHAWLAHLLENGHAKVNGGRTDPIPHVKPVSDEVENDVVELLRKKVEGSDA